MTNREYMINWFATRGDGELERLYNAAIDGDDAGLALVGFCRWCYLRHENNYPCDQSGKCIEDFGEYMRSEAVIIP